MAAFYSYREMGADLTGGDRPERIVRMPVSSEFFRVLGVSPAQGRSFSLEEERSAVPLAVISHGLWERRFGGSGDALGGTIELDGVRHEVIGIMPQGFQGPLGRHVEVWTPENLDPADGRNSRENHYLSVVARLAPVLLVGAGTLVRSFRALQTVDLAIEPAGVLTYEVHLPDSRYPTGEDRTLFYQELFPRVRALPGVTAVGATSWLPVQGRYHDWGVSRVEAGEAVGDWNGSDMRMVEGGYFRVMGIDLLQGRLFDPGDRAGADPVCIINESIQERVFAGEDPVGKLLYAAGEPRTVVGVVENVPHDPYGAESPQTYVPHTQFAGNRNWALIQAVSVQGDPLSLVPAIREEVRAVDPNLVLFRVRSMEELLSGGLARQRFSLLLMGVFAGMALLLAALGIYGVLSYLVSQRGHEIGIRMALGAEPASVRWLVVKQGITLAGAGILLGILAAWYLSRFLQTLVFQVRLADPVVFGSVALGLGMTAVLAAYLPARRATRVDPAAAFRRE